MLLANSTQTCCPGKFDSPRAGLGITLSQPEIKSSEPNVEGKSKC